MRSILDRVFLISWLIILLGVKSINFVRDANLVLHTYYSSVSKPAFLYESISSEQDQLSSFNTHNPFSSFYLLKEEYFKEKSLEDNQDDVNKIISDYSYFNFFQSSCIYNFAKNAILFIEHITHIYLINCSFLL